MLSFALLMLAAAPQETTTLPRRVDPEVVDRQHGDLPQNPVDPWFDKPLVARDDRSFVRAAIEAGRQGIVDANALRDTTPALRATAEKIGKQNTDTTRRLVALAKSKGWPLPNDVPNRTPSFASAPAARMNADFIVSQIAYHQGTVAQYRAQLAGKGDADLKRALKETLPGYERNLRLLLEVKP